MSSNTQETKFYGDQILYNKDKIFAYREKGVTVHGCYETIYQEIGTMMVCFSLHVSFNKTSSYFTAF